MEASRGEQGTGFRVVNSRPLAFWVRRYIRTSSARRWTPQQRRRGGSSGSSVLCATSRACPALMQATAGALPRTSLCTRLAAG